ncbi:MAG: single-stranded DNA-binding protein, partial [Bacteroidia bacterium]|nr:single-stranded DNA-binding protein [Bacteroidia bacterium]
MENFNAKNNLTETENTITLTGFVGTTPEYRNLGKDFKLSQFILGIKSKESEKQKTYWHTILAYGR